MANQDTPNSSIQESEKYWDKAMKALNSEKYSLAKKWLLRAAESQTKKRQSACWVFMAHCDEELSNPSESLRSLRRAERYYPKSSFIQRFIGRIQLDLSRPKLAERAFRKAIKKKPSAGAYIFLGSSLSRQGRFNDAKACYQAALRLEPDNEEAHYNLGVRYRAGKQYKKAEKHLRRAIAIDTKYAIAYAELGWVLSYKRQTIQARKILLKSVKFDSHYYWSRLYLANVNWCLRRMKEAEKQYRSAIRIRPSDSDVTAFLGDFLSCEQKGNAVHYLKKAISIDPSNSLALYYLGMHYYRNYCDEKAKYYLKKSARKGYVKAKKLLTQLSK